MRCPRTKSNDCRGNFKVLAYIAPSIYVAYACSYLGQDERLEELRDTHRLESASRSDQINKYKSQLEEAEALLKASSSSTSQSEEDTAKRNAEMEKLHAELEKAKSLVKEEEEKRVKAIGMLKTVRQKLIKAEKDKEDATKELNGIRDKEHEEIEKERAEKRKFQHEIDTVYTERDKTVAGLRLQLERDAATLKDRHEKEVSAIQGQLELEVTSLKVCARRGHSGMLMFMITSERTYQRAFQQSLTNFVS